MNTFSWEDDVEDLPLTYQFSYVSGSANESDTSSEVIVRPALESAEASGVYLPQASQGQATYIRQQVIKCSLFCCVAPR